jgi:hypothetical protein
VILFAIANAKAKAKAKANANAAIVFTVGIWVGRSATDSAR